MSLNDKPRRSTRNRGLTITERRKIEADIELKKKKKTGGYLRKKHTINYKKTKKLKKNKTKKYVFRTFKRRRSIHLAQDQTKHSHGDLPD